MFAFFRLCCPTWAQLLTRLCKGPLEAYYVILNTMNEPRETKHLRFDDIQKDLIISLKTYIDIRTRWWMYNLLEIFIIFTYLYNFANIKVACAAWLKDDTIEYPAAYITSTFRIHLM